MLSVLLNPRSSGDIECFYSYLTDFLFKMDQVEYIDKVDFEPRDYQISIMNIALDRNTIIYLPTGSGKTLIAVMILKRLSQPLQKPISQGGKISIMVVNTVALVDQQTKYLRSLTDHDVGAYSGEMNVDSWNGPKWTQQFEKHQILVMTAQILVNLTVTSILSLNSVNLLIFDECHNAVNDHAMRQIMQQFQDLEDPPRVIGLSATLLNKSCRPFQVIEEVKVLESTLRSTVATVEDSESLSGYSTNPTEKIIVYQPYELTRIDNDAICLLDDLINILDKIKLNETTVSPPKPNLRPLDTYKEFKEVICLIKDVKYHVEMFGTYVGELAVIAHTIQLERIKKNVQDAKVATVFDAITSTFTSIKKMFNLAMNDLNDLERIYKYSSPQVIALFQILEEYKINCEIPLCAIVFVQRRFTAKLIYNVLKKLKEADTSFDHINPNFVVGFNVNPFNDTRESLYKTKMNRKVLNQFNSKEINVLVASNVLEEGVDIPTCTLVVSFDQVTNYRSYIQSKGRARHRNSFYYIVVNASKSNEFVQKYTTFQEVEKILQEHLIGRNEIEQGPSVHQDDDIPPYYVNGPGSPQVNLLSAISLLCRYCSCLPSDRYTYFAPNWYIERKDFCNNGIINMMKVFIELPTISGILEPIEGPWMTSKRDAKRAAALKACELLHKCGELDDKLLPKERNIVNQDLSYYFKHWPEEKEKNAGSVKKRRVHAKQIPQVCKGLIVPNTTVYLHIIQLTPLFKYTNNLTINMISQLYESELCFGIISLQPLPQICQFTVYVTSGELLINFNVNYKTITLTSEEIMILRSFHCLVFTDILKIVKNFLVLDNDSNKDGFLVVPIRNSGNIYNIDFQLANDHKELIDQTAEPSDQEKLNLKVTEENYLCKIVTPWYRSDDQKYLVIKVCSELSPHSEFPSEEFYSYADYFNQKYRTTVVNTTSPLLLVKSLSKKLNCLKPRYPTGKRGREKVYEDMEEHFIPELCIKQEFSAALWVQATILPTIINRIISFLQADELRIQIAQQSGLGITKLTQFEEWAPLVLDNHAVFNHIESVSKPKKEEASHEELDESSFELPTNAVMELVQEFISKKLNSEFPWDVDEEPIDIERHLDVTLMDIQYFVNFTTQHVSLDHRSIRNEVPRSLPAITFDKDYVYKEIKLLKPPKSSRGPELIDIFTSLTTAKNNDIVNLERLETLGDSFLKLAISLFVILKYPTFDEGRLTAFKGQLISNKNLYYIGNRKNIGGYLKMSDFQPQFDWKPPSFCVPKSIENRIQEKEISLSSLFNFWFTKAEQIEGTVTLESHPNAICAEKEPDDDREEAVGYDSMYTFLDNQVVSDKTVADSVEALLGVYFQSLGFDGGLGLLNWLKIIPPSENIQNLLKMELPNPILSQSASVKNIDFHLPSWEKVEQKLGYNFKNRAYLLQALTHSSYTPNRITNCYQTLEFLGDAVLDFLITCHIFESCDNLSPGELTDLRSALVNNITFAGFTVRCGFQKHLLFCNNQLLTYIDNFVQYQESKNFVINEEVLYLLEEDDLYLAQHIDVPKVLGDTFEALVGAVFLDSGMCLETVWKIVHRIMWNEIELFQNNVPKNAIRLIHETVGTHPEFQKPRSIDSGGTMVGLDFMLKGAKKRVYGFGENKALAKKAAAKIALRLLHI